MICFGRVRRVYQNDGAPLCDVADEASGSVYTSCPVLLLGAGTTEQHVYAPPLAVDSRVVFAPFGGRGRGAVVLGTIAQASMGKAFNKDDVTHEQDRDYPADKVDLKDTAIRSGKSSVVLTKDGLIVLDTTQSKQSANIQLAAGGQLRISQNGDEPTEHVPLAGPLRDYLDDTVGAKLDEIGKQVQALTALAQAVNAALSAPVTPQTVAAWGVALGVASKAQPYTYVDVTATGDDMVASAILLSSEQLSPSVEGGT